MSVEDSLYGYQKSPPKKMGKGGMTLELLGRPHTSSCTSTLNSDHA